MFGSEDYPSCPSTLTTVSAKDGHDTMTEIKYGISLRGIKPNNRKINIIRSLGNNRNGKQSIILDIVMFFFKKDHKLHHQVLIVILL